MFRQKLQKLKRSTDLLVCDWSETCESTTEILGPLRVFLKDNVKSIER